MYVRSGTTMYRNIAVRISARIPARGVNLIRERARRVLCAATLIRPAPRAPAAAATPPSRDRRTLFRRADVPRTERNPPAPLRSVGAGCTSPSAHLERERPP